MRAHLQEQLAGNFIFRARRTRASLERKELFLEPNLLVDLEATAVAGVRRNLGERWRQTAHGVVRRTARPTDLDERFHFGTPRDDALCFHERTDICVDARRDLKWTIRESKARALSHPTRESRATDIHPVVFVKYFYVIITAVLFSYLR